MGPGHEGVDLAVGPAVDEPREGRGEPGMRVHAVQLGCLDERSDDGPVGPAFVAAGEEGVLAIECDGPDRTLDFPGKSGGFF